ncbi:MaoC family dehydratase [Amycolatopsis rhabdoformis]|uniref:MaoC family dehydratase n=1 Tax=Amycolatopsis rhabdoformis TaxID=1448059 RepID=A0ABZ1IFM0_9PSEU|nr:MaoC family dehydratase [Amycolatopsis rhabdoformis]WSE32546.1 MaoC family dehydratase [Amycolatopsis rhabdoformis]
MTTGVPIEVQGPYFDELAVGQRFDTAPEVTLTEGQAALHQAIVGDRLRLPLDAGLAHAVTGRAPLAHPALVWDLAIGQSTLATHHVRANLFYRGFVVRRLPRIGDTLSTVTEVVGLRQNRAREGRAPTGLAALRIETTDQDGRPVLDFWRCAMLPLRDPARDTGHHDDLDTIGTNPTVADYAAAVDGWQLAPFADRPRGPRFADLAVATTYRVVGADVVSSAPELARLTLNIARVHHDAVAAGGQRLVYGGHTIGLAMAQLTRALPNLVTVAGWDGCDHLGPVHEGDLLSSTVTVENLTPLPSGEGGLVHLRIDVEAHGDEPRPVLLWRCVAVLA